MNIQPLTWAGFAFMAAAVAAAPFVKVDFHNVGAIVAAAVSALTALAGLCLHPPWSTQNTAANAAASPAKQPEA